MTAPVPGHDCPLCPRLAAFRGETRVKFPDFFNGPVPAFGDAKPRLLIVGLAPGLKGANRTGRPFTGDYAGDLLYSTLGKYGFMAGAYRADPKDGIRLVRARITNAVKCVPPQNKPEPLEIRTCNRFLSGELTDLASVRVLLALGLVAHQAVLTAVGAKRSAHTFGHGARHELSGGRVLFDSYHCSRYNTNTGRLTEPMFHGVFDQIAAELKRQE